MLFEGYRARGPKLPARCTLPGALNSAEPCSRFWIEVAVVVLFLACFWASVADELLIQVVSWAVSQSQSIRFIHRAADPVGVRCTVCVCVFFLFSIFLLGAKQQCWPLYANRSARAELYQRGFPQGAVPRKRASLKAASESHRTDSFEEGLWVVT